MVLPIVNRPRIVLYLAVSLAALGSFRTLQAQSWTPFATVPALTLVDGRAVYSPSTNYFLAIARSPGEGCESPAQHLFALTTSTWVPIPGLDPGAPPRRARHTAVFRPASNRIIVFGGGPTTGCASDPARNDLWVLTNVDALNAATQWVQLFAGGSSPAPRYGHVSGLDAASNRLVVYGGFGDGGVRYNDVWVLFNADGSAGTPTWTQLAAAGTPPAPGSFIAGAYDATGNRLIVLNASGLTLETWVLTNANGTGGIPQWTPLLPAGAPLPQYGAIVNFDSAANRLTVFGGKRAAAPIPEESGPFTNTVWILTNANGTGGPPKWFQMNPPGTPPTARGRIGGEPLFAYDAANRRWIIAGGVSQTGPLNDVWTLLDTPGFSSVTYQINTSPPGLDVIADGSRAPSPRSFDWLPYSAHTLGVDPVVVKNPGARYRFTEWSDGGTLTHDVTVTPSSFGFTASFALQNLLTVSVAPAGSGSITQSPTAADGYFDSGTRVTLTAMANPGSAFSTFSGDLSGSTNPQTVTMSTPLSVTANFVCRPSLTQTSAFVPAVGGPLSVGVFSSPGCSWTSSSNQPWVVITQGASGSGNGNVTINVNANPGGSTRTASATMAGVPFTITQAGRSCVLSFSSPFGLVTAGGGNGTLFLSSDTSDCQWSSQSSAPWISLTTPSASTGSGNVGFAVPANGSLSTRTGSLIVGGLPFRVTQAGSVCSYTLPQTEFLLPWWETTFPVTVDAPPGCPSDASSSTPGITILTSAGSGSVEYQVQIAPNTDESTRTGSLAVAGRTISVTQAGINSPSVTCRLSPGAFTLRGAGRTERLPDLTLTCNGISPGGVVAADIVVRLNAGMTSRVVDAATDSVDALLTLGNGNTYQGRVDGPNAVRFPGVLLSAGTPVVNQPMTIRNVRVDASTLAGSSTMVNPNALIRATVTVQGSQPIWVTPRTIQGGVEAAITFRKEAPLPGANPSTQNIIPVLFQEMLADAFRPAGSGNSESGFLSGQIGGADSGTRLRLTLGNIPNGVQVLAPVRSDDGRAQLISANADGTGGAPVAVPPSGYQALTVTNGTAYAVWEVTQATAGIDTLLFNIQTVGGTPGLVAQMVLDGTLAPLSDSGIASPTQWIPRFLETAKPQKWVNLRVATSVGAASGPARLPLNANVSFTHRVTNDSDQDATNVVLRNYLPQGLSASGCTTAAGTCTVSGNAARAVAASLPSGQEFSVTVTALSSGLASGQLVQNWVSVSSDQVDADYGNNLVSLSVVGTGACAARLSRGHSAVSNSGDLGRVDVSIGPGCPWSVTSPVPWISVSNATITGPSNVRFRVAANPDPDARTAVLTVAGQPMQIDQMGTGCTISLSPFSGTIPATGGTVPLTVSTGAGCTWSASSPAAWLGLQNPILASGPGSFNLTAGVNPDPTPRTAAVSVGGQVIQVVQKSSNPPPFGDVDSANPYADYISLMSLYGITQGCGNGNFCPQQNATRGQIAVFIIRSLYGGDQFAYPVTPFFSDVPVSHPYFRHIQKLRDLGITTGCSPTAFCPDSEVTRGQMAVFLIRARLGISASTPFAYPQDAYFLDVPVVHPYFGFIQKMRELSITVGCSASTYCPDDFTTRGQMAVFVIRSFFTP